VVAAVIRIETTKTRSGLIRQTSPFAAIEVAPSESNRDSVEPLVDRLRATGLDVTVRDDEKAMLWEKFAVLEPMALLTTHERAPIGVVRTRRRDEMVALVGETAAVGNAEGVPLDRDKLLAFINSVHEAMESSMQRDQAAGRPLELDALGGALLRRADKHNIAVPVTRRIVADLAARG
jgi:2-dehydropantoate 2-reductase